MTTTAVLHMRELTALEQRRKAIARANQIRLDMAEAKREIGRGTLPLSAALEDPRLGASDVGHVLKALPGVGECKATKILRRAQLSPTRRLRELTDRQREALIGARR